MNYNVPIDQPLMISLAGQPYIDTRLSFNSYLPKDLPHKIIEKLTNEWLSCLKEKPELHDKIEFQSRNNQRGSQKIKKCFSESDNSINFWQ